MWYVKWCYLAYIVAYLDISQAAATSSVAQYPESIETLRPRVTFKIENILLKRGDP